MGTREQAVRLSLLDSTAVCGKPHVRWCGRTDGRNPVSPTRSCASSSRRLPYLLKFIEDVALRTMAKFASAVRLGFLLAASFPKWILRAPPRAA